MAAIETEAAADWPDFPAEAVDEESLHPETKKKQKMAVAERKWRVNLDVMLFLNQK
jgi:hypothetical protein